MDTRYAEATGTLSAALTFIQIITKVALDFDGCVTKADAERILEFIAEAEEKVEKIKNRTLHSDEEVVE